MVKLTEQEIIDRICRAARMPKSGAMVLGIGDDSAIFRPNGGREDLLFTTDLTIEDVHFRRETHRAGDIGWTALARGLSDIAAMGGEPRFCLISLALAPWCDAAWLSRFYRGLLALASRMNAPLMGGDLGHADKLMCDIVVAGSVPRGKALRRDGARAGDAIFMSGRLGGSALGLATRQGAAWKRHLKPEPRLSLGHFLRDALRATAAMDLSDGLSLDLRRLCLASKLSAEITLPPLYPGCTREQALHGGEDYELLFTVPPETRVPRAFAGLPLTRIGTMRNGPPGKVCLDGAPLAPRGYDHFKAMRAR